MDTAHYERMQRAAATELALYLATNPDGHVITEAGTIRGPGKLECEPLYVAWYYDRAMEGFSDETTETACGDTVDVFYLSRFERDILSQDIDAKHDRLAIRYRQDGSISTWTCSESELAEWDTAQEVERLESSADADDETDIDEDPDDYRRTASRWHDGQWSALYAFASSGTVTHGISSEIRQCLESDTHKVSREKANEAECLSALLEYVEPIEDAMRSDDESEEG